MLPAGSWPIATSGRVIARHAISTRFCGGIQVTRGGLPSVDRNGGLCALKANRSSRFCVESQLPTYQVPFFPQLASSAAAQSALTSFLPLIVLSWAVWDLRAASAAALSPPYAASRPSWVTSVLS